MNDQCLTPSVSILIVNYNGKKYLKNLFKSILEQSYSDFEILFFDNDSQDHSLDYLKDKILTSSRLKDVTSIFQSTKNLGFAKPNNQMSKIAKGKYLLFINNDMFLHKNALSNMIKVIQKNYFIAGVAPKIYLSKYLPMKIFDSVGICMDRSGSPYNRGIGQIDLGQYDYEEEVLGPCFACCLIKKDLFLQNGGLDSSYFAYFEDVDWDFRTRKEGYLFYSSPKAISFHLHSGTSNRQSYAWKYRLIFRNYLRTVMKTFGKRSSMRIIVCKINDLVSVMVNSKTPREIKITISKILVNFIFVDWWLYGLRRPNNRKYFINEIADEELFRFGDWEPSEFFNPETYKSDINLSMLDFIVMRKNNFQVNEKMVGTWQKMKKSFYCAVPNKLWKEKFDKFVSMYLNSHLRKKELDSISDSLFSTRLK